MAEYYEKKLRKVLSENNCSFHRRGKGSHDIWINNKTGATFAVPTEIRKRHTANGILKDAGIDFKF